MCNDNAVTRLKKIGFEAVAEWKMLAHGLDYSSPEDAQQQERMKALLAVNNALYAFCCGEEVLYIGKTSRSLKRRWQGYCTPGKGQVTNQRCHDKIKAELSRSKTIEILAFVPPEGMLAYHGFPINLPAGLEDILILQLAPPWNRRGSGAAILTETAELEADQEVLIVGDAAKKTAEIDRFDIKLSPTAYNRGVINVEIEASELLGDTGTPLTVKCAEDGPSINTVINRTANRNGSVRLNGGETIATWFQKHFKEGDEVTAHILGSHRIELMM